MKSHTLIPILALIWASLLIVALVDHYKQETMAAEPVASKEVDVPRTMVEHLNNRVEELNSTGRRVCGLYVSRIYGSGVRYSHGIVCIDQGMEIFMTGSGAHGELSEGHYMEFVYPVVNRLNREYAQKYGW